MYSTSSTQTINEVIVSRRRLSKVAQNTAQPPAAATQHTPAGTQQEAAGCGKEVESLKRPIQLLWHAKARTRSATFSAGQFGPLQAALDLTLAD